MRKKNSCSSNKVFDGSQLRHKCCQPMILKLKKDHGTFVGFVNQKMLFCMQGLQFGLASVANQEVEAF